MKETLLSFMACPNCGSESLDLEVEQVENDEIISGILACKGCPSKFPILSGIPSMLPTDCRRTETDASTLSLSSSADLIQQSEMVFRNSHATVYDNLSAAQAQLEIDFVLDELKLDPKQKYTILDVGCGTGRALLSLSSYSATLIGIDFSLESLNLLKSKLSAFENRESIHLVHGDAAYPPFRKGLFDVLVCVQLLQHIPGVEKRLKILDQVSRLCQRNARFVLSVFHYSFLKKIRRKTIKDPAKEVYEREGLHLGALYYHNFTGQEITLLLKQSGFQVLNQRGVNTPLTRRFGFMGARIEKLMKWSGIFNPVSHWITTSAILQD